jgi:hypothetical protein
VVNIFIAGAGSILISFFKINPGYFETAVLSLIFTIINIISLIIFFRGQSKDSESQALHSLVSVSLKFLLELVLALVWFIVAKKTSFPSVLLFFVLYLTFTLFLILVILKTLKHKSL